MSQLVQLSFHASATGTSTKTCCTCSVSGDQPPGPRLHTTRRQSLRRCHTPYPVPPPFLQPGRCPSCEVNSSGLPTVGGGLVQPDWQRRTDCLSFGTRSTRHSCWVLLFWVHFNTDFAAFRFIHTYRIHNI